MSDPSPLDTGDAREFRQMDPRIFETFGTVHYGPEELKRMSELPLISKEAFFADLRRNMARWPEPPPPTMEGSHIFFDVDEPYIESW